MPLLPTQTWDEDDPRGEDAFWASYAPVITGAFPPFRPPPRQNLLPWERTNTLKSRRHEQIVAELLNSFIRAKVFLREGENDWNLGYTPSTLQDWGNIKPLTIEAALNLVANALRGNLIGAGGIIGLFFAGSGPPPDTLADEGDYYFDVDAGTLYRKE